MTVDVSPPPPPLYRKKKVHGLAQKENVHLSATRHHAGKVYTVNQEIFIQDLFVFVIFMVFNFSFLYRNLM